MVKLNYKWLFLMIIATVSGYKHFQDLIPNGKKVPHPCKPNYVWKGVGHENVAGGGVRNPFGRDFYTNGKVWDECICQSDSDGDGRTNGEELGDPDCKWKPGSPNPSSIDLSHPGICEPLDDPVCIVRNDWEIDCSLEEFKCDELHESEDVRNITVHLTSTPVPSEETTYICQLVKLPEDGEFHMIAAKPYIDNEYVMHHLILYGCPDENVDEVRGRFENPTLCGMETNLCPSMITLWGVGTPGFCVNPEYGIRLGINGFKYALMEMHWNNPELRSDYVDGSGMTLFYTPNLRPHDGGTFFAGAIYIELPPGYREVTAEGHCTEQCTEHMLQKTIKIAAITPHMHYMGRRMVVEQRHSDKNVTVILNEEDYNYDDPQTYQFRSPIEIEPGDEIHVTCTYDSVGQDGYTLEGDATTDEMCLAIIQYYPLQQTQKSCFVTHGAGFCDIQVGSEESFQCASVLEDFLSAESEFWQIYADMTQNCDTSGAECWDSCIPFVDRLKEHVCFQDNAAIVFKWIMKDIRPEAIPIITSCDEKPDTWIKFDGDYGNVGDKDFSLCVDPVSAGSNIQSEGIFMFTLWSVWMITSIL